jgi:hypothetical protein
MKNRFIAIAITAPLVFSLCFFSFPQKSNAFGFEAVAEVAGNLFTNILTTAEQTEGTILDNFEHVRNFVLNPAAWVGGNAIVQTMARSVIDWAAHGFNGSPSFVTDLRGHLLNVGDSEAERFFHELSGSGGARSPFFQQIISNVRRNYFQSTSDDPSLQNTFTLDQIPGYEADFNQNFAHGGLNAFFQSALHCANNLYCSSMSVQGQAAQHITSARTEESTILGFGNGFLSQRSGCGTSGGSGSGTGTTGTSGTGGTTGTGTTGTGTTGTGTTGTGTTGTGGSTGSGSVQLSIAGFCLGGAITMPGNSVATALNNALNLSGQRAVQADSINELLGSLFSSLLGNVLNGGGITGATNPNTTSVRSTLDLATDPATNTSSSTDAVAASFLNVIRNQKAEVQTYKTNWTKILTAAQNAKTATASCSNMDAVTTEIQAAIDRATPAIASADAAIAELTRIQTEATSGSGTAQENSFQASTDYQTLLSSGTLPSAEDITFARTESRTTAAPAPPSLFTHMTEIATQACLAQPSS